MNKRILLVLCLLMTALLCGCRSSIIEGTEITVQEKGEWHTEWESKQAEMEFP